MTDTTSIKHPAALTSGDFTAAEEPLALFGDWFAEAAKGEPNDPNAMVVATAAASGRRPADAGDRGGEFRVPVTCGPERRREKQ